jgi:MurNAc alpha-1-phosphate uridylyltransferase
MQCVILAGGLGTRMSEIAPSVPKSLITIEGHPFLEYQLHWLVKHGVTEVVLSIGHKGDMIRAYARDGIRWGIPVVYVDEGTRFRGTGGALRLALEQGLLRSEFLVMYGDSFLPIDFRTVWQHFETREEPALMTVYRNQGRWDSSNVCFDGHKVTLYDKRSPVKPEGMDYIDYGLSVLRTSAVETNTPPEGSSDLGDVFNELSRRGELAGFEITTRFFEIGSPAGLEDFTQYVRSGAKARLWDSQN